MDLRREDILLLLLRACPSEFRSTWAIMAFSVACEKGIPEVVWTLLLHSPAAAGEQQKNDEAEKKEEDQELPKIDPSTSQQKGRL